jgi:hypothetical protein
MGPQVVVPASEEVEILLGDLVSSTSDLALVQGSLEGPEEPLDPPVLPGRKGSASLVANSEESQGKAEEPAGENDFVVGAQDLGFSKPFDEIEQRPQDRDACLCVEGPQTQTSPRAVVDHAENRLLLGPTAHTVGEIQSPDEVLGHTLG